jgi:hypothetical protein
MAHPTAIHITPRRQGSGVDAGGDDGCVIWTRAGSVINDCAELAGVARIMASDGKYREEEESVYQLSLQSGLGGSQANNTDTSYIATNITTRVEYSDSPGCGGCDSGRGIGRSQGRVARCDHGRVRDPPKRHNWKEGHARLLECINKDNRFNVLNHHPPPEALKNGKVVAIVGKQGRHTHKGKHEVNFEYSSFNTMLVKHYVIDHFVVIGDLAPRQVPPPFVAVVTPYTGATKRYQWWNNIAIPPSFPFGE